MSIIKLKVIAQAPANIFGRTGITVQRLAKGIYQFSVNFLQGTQSSTGQPLGSWIPVYRADLGQVILVPLLPTIGYVPTYHIYGF